MKKHMPLRLVRMSALQQALDHGDHARDMFGSPRLDDGRQYTQRRDVPMIDRRVSRRDGPNGHPLLARSKIDLVVDVGDVPRVHHMRVVALQHPIEHIVDDCRPGVTDMRWVVDRGAAGIERDASRIARHEKLFASGQGVVKVEAHVDRPQGSALRPRAGNAELVPIVVRFVRTRSGNSHIGGL